MELNILYEDKAIIVCEKPVGVLSQVDAEGKGSDMPTLLSEYFVKKGERARKIFLSIWIPRFPMPPLLSGSKATTPCFLQMQK